MDWIKTMTNRSAHPDIQEAGFWGLRAFDEVCLVSGQFDLSGDVPAKYASAAYLARRMMATDLPDGVKQVADGLAKCVAVGLLKRAGSGFVIPGWDRIQSETKSTARVKKFRAKQRSSETDETDETLQPFRETEETLKREEREEREEKRVTSKSASADPDLSPLLAIPSDAESEDATALLLQLEVLEAKRRFGPTDLVALWNEQAHPTMSRVRDLTPDRTDKIRTRLREHPEPEWWAEVIAAGNASPHCRGESRPAKGAAKPWRLTLSFLIENPSNAVKVLEGEYGDDREPDPIHPNDREPEYARRLL